MAPRTPQKPTDAELAILRVLWSRGPSTVREVFRGIRRTRGVAPALHHLAYVGRAITPVPSPIRFHARFFVADARYTTGTLGGDSELEDLHWCPVNELVRLPTIDVQSFMLSHAIATLTCENSETTAKPLFTQRTGQRYIRYSNPHL